ncbi:hypothetical protein [Thermanaerothrix sp.]|nr:hypothetical protein [Thermanaerothrix sp.]
MRSAPLLGLVLLLALAFWEQAFLPRCAAVVQVGEWARLYHLTTCAGE